ncbi:uncharacterized protein TRAVEDRAFT_48295 [Trametes versicolor FP-101664 SS1]|uniref:uncharacterized protein n=1 Tax=Trametes versicolor (strain FP-101664) TaxID=717944 RepID=UPI0004621927|nr:uncharacterized protein TRAVEDRAFT_48295 [Trametes versicolor FP-101664 SS1]EIW57252.1 hypothetical protein TRAVEDRAFT_48295 [Trametes versicolor FP-101664 SS1]
MPVACAKTPQTSRVGNAVHTPTTSDDTPSILPRASARWHARYLAATSPDPSKVHILSHGLCADSYR